MCSVAPAITAGGLLAAVIVTPLLAYIAYGVTGFFPSMVYGPVTKEVPENVDPLYAPRCSLGYDLASFLGTPLAGLLVWTGLMVAGVIVALPYKRRGTKKI